MQKSSNKVYKLLVVGVIVLFIGVAVQPAIADVSIEPDNSELVEITVQFYEVDRTYNHTVLLTKEQVRELENLINNFEIKLDRSDNKIETEAIYKDAVVSLNDYGILPEDMSVDKAQRLVTGKELNTRFIRFFERWYSKNPKSLDDNENILCLIAGKSSQTAFFAPIGRILMVCFEYLPYFLLSPIFYFILIGTWIWTIKPLSFGYEIGLGKMVEIPPGEPDYYPSKGWVNTIGLGGLKKWNGSFYGQLPLSKFFIYWGLFDEFYPGVFGFIGIKIGLITTSSYFGFALRVKIGEKHP